jgi:hypothetical protein
MEEKAVGMGGRVGSREGGRNGGKGERVSVNCGCSFRKVRAKTYCGIGSDACMCLFLVEEETEGVGGRMGSRKVEEGREEIIGEEYRLAFLGRAYIGKAA